MKDLTLVQRINRALRAPATQKAILGMGLAMPIIYFGVRFAYSLLTGDHAQTAHSVTDVVLAEHTGEPITTRAFPNMVPYDANHDGLIQSGEYQSFRQHCTGPEIIPRPENVAKLAEFSSNKDGSWGIREFGNYLFWNHVNLQEQCGQDLVEAPDGVLQRFADVNLGGKFVPFDVKTK
jgi:hypothetical protein